MLSIERTMIESRCPAAVDALRNSVIITHSYSHTHSHNVFRDFWVWFMLILAILRWAEIRPHSGWPNTMQFYSLRKGIWMKLYFQNIRTSFEISRICYHRYSYNIILIWSLSSTNLIVAIRIVIHSVVYCFIRIEEYHYLCKNFVFLCVQCTSHQTNVQVLENVNGIIVTEGMGAIITVVATE